MKIHLTTPILWLGLVCFLYSIHIKNSNAQEANDWQFVQKSLYERSNKVNQSYFTGLFSDYKSAKDRLSYYEDVKKTMGPDFVPYPVDPNYVAAFSWFTDGLKWRVDVRRVYPEIGQDFKQSSFDGETYTSYDEYSLAGNISPEKDENVSLYFNSKDSFEDFSSDTVVGYGVVSQIESIWKTDKKTPSYEKDEVVTGISCNKYGYSSAQGDSISTIEIWFSPADNAIVKYTLKNTSHRTNSGSMIIYVANKFKDVAELHIPMKVKSEIYTIDRGRAVWRVTREVSFDSVRINDKNAVSAFGHPVRVTAQMENTLEDPGASHAIGGNPIETIAAVRKGTPPDLEETNAQFEGEAPEVAQAQAAMETTLDK